MSFPFGEENSSGYPYGCHPNDPITTPIMSGRVVSSGSVGSGQIYTQFTASGSVGSGQISSGFTLASGPISSPYQPICNKCGLQLGENRVTVMGVSGLYLVQCYSCVGYSFKKGFGFQDQKTEWIEASVSGMFHEEEHKGIIVDWLDENQRPGDAEFLREYYNMEIK